MCCKVSTQFSVSFRGSQVHHAHVRRHAQIPKVLMTSRWSGLQLSQDDKLRIIWTSTDVLWHLLLVTVGSGK